MSVQGSFGLPAYVPEKLWAIFQQYPQIERVLVYGSRAKGSQRPESDIDLAIVGNTLGLAELLAIETRIDDLLMPWMVDLSLLHQIDNPDLIDHIRRVGVPLYTSATTADSQKAASS